MISNHEPECTYRTESTEWSDIIASPCICPAIRSAYRRGIKDKRQLSLESFAKGYADGYLEGREEAAWDVTKVSCLRDTDLCDIGEAIAAARGNTISKNSISGDSNNEFSEAERMFHKTHNLDDMYRSDCRMCGGKEK